MLDVLRVLVERLQEMAVSRFRELDPFTGTCSREFIAVVEEFDRELTRLGEKYGLRRVDIRVPVRGDDLRVSVFLAEGGVVEVGLRGLNKCAPLVELLGERMEPRAYGRVLGPGASVVAEVEAEAGRREEAGPSLYYF